MAVKVITGKVRLSYANVWTPKVDDKGVKYWQVSVLIPKSDTVTINKVKAAIEEVKNDPNSIQKWGGKFNAEMKGCIRDGDLKAEEHPEYAGHLFFSAKSFEKPGLVGPDRQPILDGAEIYSGCYAYVSVNFYAFNKQSKGIAAGLNNIMKVADGDRLGEGRASAEDDFADVPTPTDAPAAGAKEEPWY